MVLNYPPRWVKIHSERGYYRIDPVFEYADGVKRPFHWDDPKFRGQLTAAQRAIMAHARQFELEHGYTIPCSLQVVGPNKEMLKSSCSVVPSQRELPPLNYTIAANVATHLFVAVARLRGIDLSVPATHMKSKRKNPEQMQPNKPGRNSPPGIYHASLYAAQGRKLFTRKGDYTHFETLLAASLKRTGTEILLYCWLPQSIHLTLRTHDVQPDRFLQGLISSYVRWLHADTHESGPQLNTKPWKVPVHTDRLLLAMTNFVHHLPMRFKANTDLDSYPHSSHQVYLGRKQAPWLTTDQVWQALGAQNDAQAAYARLMAEPATPLDDPSCKHMFDAPASRKPPDQDLTIDTIVNGILDLLNVHREDLFSESRHRAVTAARAAIAWYARELKVASLAETARYLRRSTSSLSHLIAHHRSVSPELFKLDFSAGILPTGNALKRDPNPTDQS